MTKSFYTLSEAYHQVYRNQDVISEEETLDIEDWLDELVSEGYDLDEYSDEEILDAYYSGLDEENKAEKELGMTKLERIASRNTSSQPAFMRTRMKLKKPLEPRGSVSLELHSDSAKKRQKQHQERRGVKTRGTGIREEVHFYDIISEYLVSEGFCESYEDADVIMANMSEEWRESILDEAVKGSQRSIGNRITGNDIRKVTRGKVTVYKKPKWKDDVENEVHGGSQLRQRGETEYINDTRDRKRIEANKKRINRLNASKNIEQQQADGDYENSIDFSRPSRGKSGYMEVPTDWHARQRRRRGR